MFRAGVYIYKIRPKREAGKPHFLVYFTPLVWVAEMRRGWHVSAGLTNAARGDDVKITPENFARPNVKPARPH